MNDSARIQCDEEGRGCRGDSPWILRQDHLNWFHPSGLRIRYCRCVSMGEKGTLRHYGATVRCLDRIHLMAYAAKLG